jgi:hypothetical protein
MQDSIPPDTVDSRSHDGTGAQGAQKTALTTSILGKLRTERIQQNLSRCLPLQTDVKPEIQT